MKSIYEQNHLQPINGMASRMIDIPASPKFKKKKKSRAKAEVTLSKKSITKISEVQQHRMESCIKCNTLIRADRMVNHLKKVHFTVIVKNMMK